MEQIYKKLSDYAKENGVIYRTAWNRYKAGKIAGAFMDETGHVKIPIKKEKREQNAILYARVSTNDRKKSLNEQSQRLKEFATKNGFVITRSVKEIASGMNDNRAKLTKILTKNDWDVLIVENKDRLTRFGFNYIKTLLNKQKRDIIVINQEDDDKKELINDLISIIYSFSARMYGLRRRKKREEIFEFLETQK
jgi:predicted site-specific integrase-resolvase